MYNFKDVEKALKENNLWGKQVFFSRNTAGDEMDLVYEHDGILIEYCPFWDYIEVFGLTVEDQKILEDVYIIKRVGILNEFLLKK